MQILDFPSCLKNFLTGRHYKSQQVETMPWYNENLDSDLEEELDHREITNCKFLDLGTGPATQAIWLTKRGFNVTGSDLSEAAIKRARTVYANEKNVNFVVDDILNSNLKENQFDYIFDRGCFHVEYVLFPVILFITSYTFTSKEISNVKENL